MEKHFAASGVILNADHSKVLLLHHKKLAKWLFPGGHVEPNESPDETVVREIQEEVGLMVTLLQPDPLTLPEERQLPIPYCILEEDIPAHKDTPQHKHVDFIFLTKTDTEKIPETAEKHDAGWYTKAEVQTLDTFPSIKQICSQVMRD
ncbi:MAG: NUDIX domain-containing protein [Patescibacteria group bacterium]